MKRITCPSPDSTEKWLQLRPKGRQELSANRQQAAIVQFEQDMGKRFGDAKNPLLLSCRIGAAVSMPGMMDTVLNV